MHARGKKVREPAVAAAAEDIVADDPCIVCFKSVELYSVGPCDHPVCYECSTRMRVLCKQLECPICRSEMPQVIFTRKKLHFRKLVANPTLADTQHGLQFCSRSVQDAYARLLEFNCQRCGAAFLHFAALRDHMQRAHQLFYCDLCVTNLKIFASERRAYTRNELATHRRKGDKDNRSHRGHPLCEFCDVRYMDTDDLYRHLRREHYFCHFCDADGKHQYYPDYESLRVHFARDHFLCEEGACREEQFTTVFRTDIDLRAHIASVHARQLGRAATKQARTLELEFNFGPRPGEATRHSHSNRRNINHRNHQHHQQHDAMSDEEGAVGYAADPSRGPLAAGNNNSSGGGSGSSSTVKLTVNQDNRPQRSNVSIHVNHNGAGGARSSASIQVRPKSGIGGTPEAFPALGGSGGGSGATKDSLSETCGWVLKGAAKIRGPAPSSSATDFPMLPASGGNKKSSSVTVAMPSKVPANTSASRIASAKGVKRVVPTTQHQQQHQHRLETTSAPKNAKSKKKAVVVAAAAPHKTSTAPMRGEDVDAVVTQTSTLRIGTLGQPHEAAAAAVAVAASVPVRAPPGINVKPPPGFNALAATSNDMTFHNSSGESYHILPNNNHGVYKFLAPRDHESRNRALIRSLSALLHNDDAAIAMFQRLSELFRAGQCFAVSYYEHCEAVMGERFAAIFPELLVLLPDIGKQRALYEEFRRRALYSDMLAPCTVCGQIVLESEEHLHFAQHYMDDNFPSLGAAVGNGPGAPIAPIAATATGGDVNLWRK